MTIHPKRTTAIKKITASPLVEKMLRKSEQGLPEIKKRRCFRFFHAFCINGTFDTFDQLFPCASFRTIGLSSGSKSGLGVETRLRFGSPILPFHCSPLAKALTSEKDSPLPWSWRVIHWVSTKEKRHGWLARKSGQVHFATGAWALTTNLNSESTWIHYFLT